MIIIPIYATKQLEPVILRSLASIKNTTDRPICYVDDGSPLSIDFEPTGQDIVVRNNENQGYTKAVNTGLRYAMTLLNDVFIVGNDDLFFEDGQWEWVNDCKENTIVSPKTSDEGWGDMFGSIWAVHRTVIDKIGYLNEKLEHFFSDTEYYHRAKWNGVNIIKRGDIVINHVGSATYNYVLDRSEKYDNDQKIYRNMV